MTEGGNGEGIATVDPQPPAITRVDPAAAAPGAPVTITGTDFGTTAGTVTFSIPGGASATAAITGWTATSIAVTVPPLQPFGSGGPLDVVVRAGTLASAPAPFLLLEPTAPEIAGLAPQRGLEQTPFVVSGTHFGRRSAGSAVCFAPAGVGPKVEAEILAWQPEAVRARVPALTALRSAGTKNVAVKTPWGESRPSTFVVGELPSISSVNPPSASPGAAVTLAGRAFGAKDGSSKVELVTTYISEEEKIESRAPMPIESWSETRIETRVPPFSQILTSGEKRIVVTTQWGPSQGALFSVNDRASVTSWTRLEPHARVDDLELGLRTGLQARVDDALWLLGRQWQIGELHGEDAGSPVAARVVAEAARVSRWRPGGGQALDVPAHVPLEALAERETIFPPLGAPVALRDRRLAAEAGLQFLRYVAARLGHPDRADDYRKRYLDVYALPPPTGEERLSLPAETVRFLDLVAGRAPDGSRLYADLWVALPPARGGQGRLPDRPPVAGSEQAAITAAIGDWFGWVDSLFSDARGAASAWDGPRLEYSFAVAARTSGGEVVLEAREYDGNRLDWYSFAPGAAGESLGAGGPATPVGRSVVPSPASYPGMPAPRWWELESSRVDFGGVEAGPSDLLRLLFVEFALVYGNDWFVLPVDRLPVGSVCRLDSLVVTDTFGVETEVTPFTGDVGAGEAWRMFRLTGGPGDLLFNPGALPSSLVSQPLEEVLFTRDELANLAWVVERVVEGPGGRPVDRLEAYQARRGREDAAAPPPEPLPPGTPALAYRLATSVPPYWIPFVPTLERNAGGQVVAKRLVRAALPDGAGPQGELLEAGEASFALYDEEVPRAGVRATRTWEYARGSDGSTHLWRGRRTAIGQGASSSGLRFDVLERRDVPQP